MLQCEMITVAVSTRLPNRGWTYAEYCRIPEDGKRHEIIDGRHYVTPAPDFYHQEVALGLASELRAKIRNKGRGRVGIAPTDVLLGPGLIVQPDVVAVRTSRAAIVGLKKITGTPDLVVEVLSPRTQRRDRGVKMRGYERAGVAEYWLVDPKQQTIAVYVLKQGKFVAVGECTERIESHAFPGVVIDLREIW